MSDKQRRALGAMEAARARKCSLAEYAKAKELSVRELYDALAALRRKGALAKSVHGSKSQFVSVRVGPASSTTLCAVRAPGASGVLCRIVQRGCVVECMQWPEPRWVAQLGSGSLDAAS